MTQNVAITGNTYPVKDALKALGARWNADQKAWMVSADKADVARKIVAGGATTSSPTTQTKSYHPTKCIVCGCKQGQRNSRGYIDGPRILRNGECSDCYEERKMGY